MDGVTVSVLGALAALVELEVQTGAETHVKALCIGLRERARARRAVRVFAVENAGAVVVIALEEIPLFDRRLGACGAGADHDRGLRAAVRREQLDGVRCAELDRRAAAAAGLVCDVRAVFVAFDVLRGGLDPAAHGLEQVVRDQLGAVQLLRAARDLGRRAQGRAEHGDDQTEQSGADDQLDQRHALPAAQDRANAFHAVTLPSRTGRRGRSCRTGCGRSRSAF